MAIVFVRPATAEAVQPLFELSLSSTRTAPFPSDRFTVPDDPDDPNNTGLRVNLPKPDCSVQPSDCTDIDLLDELDGFSLLPRLSIPFSGSIDANTANSASVFFVRIGTALGGDAEVENNGAPVVVGINKVVWDPATLTLHAWADDLLEQYTRYLLVVTNAVHDASGGPIERSAAFDRFRHDENFGQSRDPALKRYRKSLLVGLSRAAAAGVKQDDIAVASVFTTQTITSVLERIRDDIRNGTPAAADFDVGLWRDPSTGVTQPVRAVFPASDVKQITFNSHTGFDKAGNAIFRVPGVADRRPNLALLHVFDVAGAPPAVGQIAFGRFSSPQYLGADGRISTVGTLAGVPPAQSATLHFTLFIPSGTPPATGWPVAIWGHLLDNNKNGTSFHVASGLNAHGIAVIAINAVGHGFGPLGTLAVTLADGRTVTVPAGGRGVDLNHDNAIGIDEGFYVSPLTLALARDARRQTAIDLMQLVRVIQAGIDVDGDGTVDLDQRRTYYAGVSLGSNIGILAAALDPGIGAAYLSALNGLDLEELRLSPTFRAQSGAILATRVPPVFNGPSCIPATTAGCAAFQENIPFRDVLPVTNTIPGAMEIQEVIERGEWINMLANPIAFAPALQKQPLGGLAPKPVIVLMSKGDQGAPNPPASALVRAGDLAGQTTYFRNDLAFASCTAGSPCVDKDPHRVLIRVDSPAGSPNFTLAVQAQEQVGAFFASDAESVIDPDGDGPLFELPLRGPLPEELNFIP